MWDQAYSISRKFLGHLCVCTYWGGSTLRCSKSMFLSMVLFRFFHSVTQSDCLGPHGLQHGRLPCPSPTPGACSNSCPSSWQCHPTISSSVVPFSSFLQFFPASGSFPRSQLIASDGQIIGDSASASQLFHSPLSLSSRGSLVPLYFLP